MKTSPPQPNNQPVEGANAAELAAGLASTPGYRYADRVGDELFVAGQVPLDHNGDIIDRDDPAAQAGACLENLRTLIDVHHFDLDDVRHLTIYVVGEHQHLLDAWSAVTDWFAAPVPPATLLGVNLLGHSDQLVEIDATIRRHPNHRRRAADEPKTAPMPADHIAATQRAYSGSARQFVAAVGTTVSPEFEAPIDLAILATFVDLARRSSGVTVDAGCGTGRIARYLADGGLDVLGIDVAPGMIDQARRAHPDIAFEIAELTSLPCEPATAAAVAYWYSIITTPPDALDDVWSELDLVLAPAGVLLVAFQCGTGEQIHRPNAYGTSTNLTLFRHDPAHVRTGLESVGLSVHTFAQREPRFDHESSDQAFIIATDAR